MREIKFRIIWKGKKYYWGFIDGGFAGITITNDGLNMEMAKKLSCQYTGIKDKNGFEIWESDIIHSIYPNNQTVIWDEETAMFGYYYKDVSGKHFVALYRHWEDIEIKGNQFQNPEL